MNKSIELEKSNIPIELPDRMRWDKVFDADRLREDVSELLPHLQQRDYVYYNVVPLRGALTPPRLSAGGVTDFSDPSLYDWGDFPLMEHCPSIKELVEWFEADATNVRLMRLEAGAVVKEHRDPTLGAEERSVVRLTIPIFSNDGVTFLLNDTVVPMQPGEVWYMRLSDRHAVFNDSVEERINLSVDLIYNDWLEEKLVSLAQLQKTKNEVK